MKRDRAYIRRQRKRAIRRKCRILYRLGGQTCVNGWARGAAGRFAKGKIHCSCPMCRLKSCDEPGARDKRAAERAKEMLDDAVANNGSEARKTIKRGDKDEIV